MAENITLDSVTIGRYAPRVKTYTPQSSGYKIVFTRGDDLVSPGEYKRSFGQAMERAIYGGYNVSDDAVARAAAVGTTAFVCSEYRATTTAGIPLKVVSPSGETLADTMLSGFALNASNLMANSVRSLLIWGRMYLRKRRNADGWPTGLEWINPLNVTEYLDHSTGRVLYYDVLLNNGFTREKVAPEEIIYKQAFDPTPLSNGLSRFEVAWRALNVEQGIVTHAAAFFTNGAQIDGMLTFDTPLSDDQYDKARTEWRENFRGAKHAHKIAIMPFGATYTPMQSVPKDLAMVELKSSEREDICAIFEVDPILVGLKGTADPLSANSTYGTTETAHIRRVTLPMLNMLVLPALNQQWAHRDFDKRNYYTIKVDEANISALSEANLAKADTAITVTNDPLLDYAEGRRLLGYSARETDYLRRNPSDALSLWSGGGLTFNALHQLIGTPGYTPTPNGDVVNVGGSLYPLNRLLEVANKNVENLTQLPPVAPFGVLPPSDNTPPVLPPDTGVIVSAPEQPQLPAPTPEPTLANGRSGVLMLALPNQPDLIGLQNRVHQMLGDIPCEWNKPEDFHITLVYMPSITDEQVTTLGAALLDTEVPDLSLRVGQLNVFDNVGEHALHFRIGRNGDLLEWQDELYGMCQALGIPMSAYSEPSQYKPHITMGYSEQPIKRVPFHSSLKVTPTELRFVVDDEIVYQSANNPPVLARSLRSDMPLTIGISFADNQFIRYAKRALSEALTAQGVNAQWLPEDQWHYTLGWVNDWTPNSVSGLLKTVGYEDARKVDVRSTGFEVTGKAIYLKIDKEALEPLEKSVGLDLRGVSQDTIMQTAQPGILLCTTDSLSVNLDGIAPQEYPLVGNNVTLYLGMEAYHRWNLRGVSSAQLTELKNWRHKVERKGTDTPFEVSALEGQTVAAFVADALTAGVSIEDTFTIAESALRGEYEIRAYADTRDAFVSELVTIIGAAQKSDIDRRNFAARMRTQLRRLGLVAFRDGMNEEGYDPEGFSPDELNSFNKWLAEQSGYITNFGGEIFKQGITEAEVKYRAEMWADVSLYQARLLGIAAGAPKQMYKRVWNPSAEHCPECEVLNGQVHSMEEWVSRRLLPGQEHTQCGPGCRCALTKTDDKESGDWLG